MAREFTPEDDTVLAELGVEVEAKKAARSLREERIIAGFEDIQKFVSEHGHAPRNGEDKDIFERLYAVRLDCLRASAECRDVLEPLDRQGLLDAPAIEADRLDDDALLADLGIEPVSAPDITVLKHVKSKVAIRAAEDVANRTRCEDFDAFKLLFESVRDDIDTGARETTKFRKDAGFAKIDITQGRFIILGGQTAYVAEVGKTIKAPNGEDDARLRVIYSNETESNILLRSLIRAMYKDTTSRLISELSAGPLFACESEDKDTESGTIYVLRSKSDHATIAANRDVIHKIGVTGGSVEARIAQAKLDPTFLMADVDVVATYELYNINRTLLEALIHRFFSPARLELEIPDRFGRQIRPREWYLAPLSAVNEAVEKIRDGTIAQFVYDPSTAGLKPN